MLLFTLLAVVASANGLFWGLIGSEQSVAVKGKLICNGIPASHIKVKLYEKETVLDRFMSESETNENGVFEIAGTKIEVSSIDPKLNIYHRCNYDGILSKTCYKKVSISIPKNFVTKGKIADKTFDIGQINLAGKYGGESTDCFN